jgi:hypothetical protein
MDELGKIFEIICSLPHRLKTRLGGLVLTLLTGIAAYKVRFVPYDFLKLLGVSVPLGWVTVVWIFVLAGLSLFWWLLWSGRMPPFRQRKRVVAFCMERKNARIHNYYTQSIDHLKSFIAQCGLSDEIEIRDIGYDIICSDSDAQKFVMRKGVAAVFHGRLFLDQEKGDFIHHYSFNVTWRNPPQISQDIAKLIEVDSNLFYSNRNWNIRELDSKNDQQRVAGGFAEIVLFLVVISQITDRKSTAKNIEILEKLRAIIAKANQGVTVTLKSGEVVPAEAIPFLRQGRVNALLRDLYLDYSGICIRSTDYTTAQKLLTSALLIPSDPAGQISVLVPLAVCCYHLGQLDLAKKYSQQIGNLDSGNAHSLVNLAFLEIVDQNYEASTLHYRKYVLGQYHNEQLVTQVVEFLGERSKEMPTETAFLFAIGALNFAYLDHEQGKADLTRFVSEVANERKYRQMVNFSNQLLTRGLEGTRKHLKKQQRRKLSR